MKIYYLGHSCFKLVSDQGTSVVTDPYKGVGYELPLGLSAEAITVSHGHFDHNNTQAVAALKIFSKAGRYSVNDVEIVGIESWHDPLQGKLRGDNIIFKMWMDGLTVCHLGDLGESCGEALLQKIGRVDVLLIPVGGTYTIDAPQAKEYVEKISPKVVIPMHYRPIDGKLDVSTIDEFLNLFDSKDVTVVKDGIVEISPTNPQKKTHIIYMERMK